MENEIWKDIKGYENLYQISNLGNVNSFKFNKVKELKKYKNSNGYLAVNLSHYKSKPKSFLVHRLVAEAFVLNSNPKRFNIVNHKDENRMNANYENLEWCDHYYNLYYNNGMKKRGETLRNIWKEKKSWHYYCRVV